MRGFVDGKKAVIIRNREEFGELVRKSAQYGLDITTDYDTEIVKQHDKHSHFSAGPELEYLVVWVAHVYGGSMLACASSKSLTALVVFKNRTCYFEQLDFGCPVCPV